MEFADLPDDILRLIIEQIDNLVGVIFLSRTCRRIAAIARTNLRHRRYRTFWIGIYHHGGHVGVPLNLLRLIVDHSIRPCVRVLSMSIDAGDFSGVPVTHQQGICDMIYDIQMHYRPLSPQLRTILHVLEQDMVHLVDGSSWYRLCMNVVHALLWLCPSIRRLEMKNLGPGSVHEQLLEIGNRLCLTTTDDLQELGPEPYGQLTRLFKIEQLHLPSINYQAMHELDDEDAFNVLCLPTLKGVELERLDTEQQSRSHFWPVNYPYTCSARQVVINFKHKLPDPTIIANLLSRCTSLQAFELRQNSSNYNVDLELAESIIEEADMMANHTLRKISHEDVKGLVGYADLIRTSLGTLFEERAWELGCFLPCKRPQCRQLPVCFCTVVSIKNTG